MRHGTSRDRMEKWLTGRQSLLSVIAGVAWAIVHVGDQIGRLADVIEKIGERS